jgi:hypothetical protein
MAATAQQDSPGVATTPDNLGTYGKALWDEFAGRDLSPRQKLQLLEAAQLSDLAAKSRAAASEGEATTATRYQGSRQHPALAASIRLTRESQRILKALGLV